MYGVPCAELPIRFALSLDALDTPEKRAAALSPYLNLQTVAAGEREWEKSFVCAVQKREGTNELVGQMLEQMIKAAEHQYRVLGPDSAADSGSSAAKAATSGGGLGERSMSASDRMLAEQLGR